MAPLYEYRDIQGVRVYQTVEEFIRAVEDALHHDTGEQRTLRQAQVRNCPWDVRTQQLGGLIASLLQGRTLQEAAPPQVLSKTTPAGESAGRQFFDIQVAGK